MVFDDNQTKTDTKIAVSEPIILDLEKENTYLKNSLHSLQSENTLLNQKLSVKNNKNTALSINNLSTDNAGSTEALKLEIDRLLQLTGQKESEIEILRKNLSQQKKENEDHLKLIGKKESLITTLKKDFYQTRSELDNILKLVSTKENLIVNLKAELNLDNNKIKKLKTLLISARREATEYKKRLDDYKEQTKKKNLFWKNIHSLFSKLTDRIFFWKKKKTKVSISSSDYDDIGDLS